jgi:DNA-binding MarR family transcriptional regulator
MNKDNKPATPLADAATPLHRAVFELFRNLRMTRPSNALGMSKLGALGFLQRGGATTATELATYLRLQPQSMTRLLADLEERGLIVRQPDAVDRRQNQIVITPAGTELLQKDVLAQRGKLAEKMNALLTPTEQELLRLAAGLMSRLAQSVEADNETEIVQQENPHE